MDQYGITAIGKSAPVLLLSLFLLIAGHLRGSSASVDGKRVARCLFTLPQQLGCGVFIVRSMGQGVDSFL